MATRSLLSGPVTLFDAEGRDRNILHALQYRKQEKAFCERIEGFRPLLTDVVAHHLSIKAYDRPKVCYNSLSITISRWRSNKFRKFRRKDQHRGQDIPWLQRNCPEVPISQVYVDESRIPSLLVSLVARARRFLLPVLGFSAALKLCVSLDNYLRRDALIIMGRNASRRKASAQSAARRCQDNALSCQNPASSHRIV
ncbi:hypothetical protein IF2G_06155 [Cordyceps javanica]|nr:hypothetical protein IF2G_06155 [Cordyceps javanica]